jgi:hypothetical protein
MNKMSLTSNVNIEMKWWPRPDGTSRHIWLPVDAENFSLEAPACDETECIASQPGVCPCGKVEWVALA